MYALLLFMLLFCILLNWNILLFPWISNNFLIIVIDLHVTMLILLLLHSFKLYTWLYIYKQHNICLIISDSQSVRCCSCNRSVNNLAAHFMSHDSRNLILISIQQHSSPVLIEAYIILNFYLKRACFWVIIRKRLVS